jgi:hypothetical protein
MNEKEISKKSVNDFIFLINNGKGMINNFTSGNAPLPDTQIW